MKCTLKLFLSGEHSQEYIYSAAFTFYEYGLDFLRNLLLLPLGDKGLYFEYSAATGFYATFRFRLSC
jgi:hypothetical protein